MADEVVPAVEPVVEAKREQTVSNKNKNRQGGVNQKVLLERANRIARQQVNAKLGKVAKALGLEKFDEASLEAKLAELSKTREEGLPLADKFEARMRELEEKAAFASTENARMKSDLNRARRDRDKEIRKRRDMETEYELRQTASRAGIQDPDYALHLFGEHVRKTGDSESVDPSQFFEGLKMNKSYRYLFATEEVGAGPRPGVAQAATQQAAPAQQARAEQTPAPSVGQQAAPPPALPGKGITPDVEDVEKMSQQDFKRRTAEKYGYRQGL